MSSSGQLALSFFRGPSFAEVDFCRAESNAAACAWLCRTAEWPNHRLALWGEAGCGKTHLLRIWSQQSGAMLCSRFQLPGLPDVQGTGIAIDDAADVIGDERALLHLLNAADEVGTPVLLAARTPPARWGVSLPDLASRLRAMMAVEIGAPEDTLLQALLARLLADRQLRLPGAVQDWLVRRLPRSAAALRDAVERLDAAALDEHRTITARFAARVLAPVLGPDEISRSGGAPSQDDRSLL
jgi:chromosomal replication initiation ATPase DnaA